MFYTECLRICQILVRRRADSNRRIAVLQTAALPLGDAAIYLNSSQMYFIRPAKSTIY